NEECLDGGEGHDGQEGKSKLRILAEILAAGYQLEETLLSKVAEVDAKYGLSAIFKEYFTFFQANLVAIDDKYKVTDTVRELDSKYAVQDKVKKTVSQAQDKAHCVLDSNTGKLALDIYEKVTKQVGDLHCKAKQIANEKKAALQ
ncbi:11335_t:CDS:2, partial [Dentiscutata erythropus]